MLYVEAVQMGTRFVVAKESDVHQLYKDRIIAARDIDSVVTGRSTGHPVRSLRNETTRQYLNMEKENVSFEELEHLTLGALRKAVVDGDVKMNCNGRSDCGNGKKRTDMQRDNYRNNG